MSNDSPFQMDTRGEFSFPEQHAFDAGYGLTEATIDYICDAKGEPDWLREFRKAALRKFREMPMPTHWAPEGIAGWILTRFATTSRTARRPARAGMRCRRM